MSWAGLGGSEETLIANPEVPGSCASNGPVATAARGLLSLGNQSPPPPQAQAAPDPQQACRHPTPMDRGFDSGPHLPPETLSQHKGPHQLRHRVVSLGLPTSPCRVPGGRGAGLGTGRGARTAMLHGSHTNLGKAGRGFVDELEAVL